MKVNVSQSYPELAPYFEIAMYAIVFVLVSAAIMRFVSGIHSATYLQDAEKFVDLYDENIEYASEFHGARVRWELQIDMPSHLWTTARAGNSLVFIALHFRADKYLLELSNAELWKVPVHVIVTGEIADVSARGIVLSDCIVEQILSPTNRDVETKR